LICVAFFGCLFFFCLLMIPFISSEFHLFTFRRSFSERFWRRARSNSSICSQCLRGCTFPKMSMPRCPARVAFRTQGFPNRCLKLGSRQRLCWTLPISEDWKICIVVTIFRCKQGAESSQIDPPTFPLFCCFQPLQSWLSKSLAGDWILDRRGIVGGLRASWVGITFLPSIRPFEIDRDRVKYPYPHIIFVPACVWRPLCRCVCVIQDDQQELKSHQKVHRWRIFASHSLSTHLARFRVHRRHPEHVSIRVHGGHQIRDKQASGRRPVAIGLRHATISALERDNGLRLKISKTEIDGNNFFFFFFFSQQLQFFPKREGGRLKRKPYLRDIAQ
jgi:hypothetical protein